jgi:two-component system CheB/CheR fusion protein
MKDLSSGTSPAEGEDESNGVPDESGDFNLVLDHLRLERGFDFSGYKRASLARRVRRRMQAVGIHTFRDYVDHLEVHPDEFSQLFDVVLINVTSFFRDGEPWTALREQVEHIVASKPDGAAIRCWSAGCASGEEAYSLAMLLSEILGPAELARRVKIYATDVDEDALTEARAATYPLKRLEGLPPELVTKYFTPLGSSYVFARDLRRAVIFGRHDLVQDAPISRVDVLLCRNALMYFNAETQARVLAKLHFALNSQGVLLLGKAEMILTHGALFSPIDLKLRLFSPAASIALRDRAASADIIPGRLTEAARSLHQTSFDALPLAVVVLDGGGRIALVNARASALFGLSSRDVGRPFQDLELSYRPAELRSLLERSSREHRSLRLERVERELPNEERTHLDVEVAPLLVGSTVVGMLLSFTDVTRSVRLEHDVRSVTADLQASHEELQSASEELETTNEELQSTVEELETTNEELHSTNEELETMNGELQSTNAELQTLNAELIRRGDEATRADAFSSAILESLNRGVVVLDRDFVVLTWNAQMVELWGLRADEVIGRHLLDLDIGLPVEALRLPLRECLVPGSGTVERDLDCTSRRGRPVRCRVTMRAMLGQAMGVVMVVDEVG